MSRMPSSIRFFIRLLACALLAAPFASTAHAEYVEVRLKDGRAFTGRVLEETPYKIKLSVEISRIPAIMTFTLGEVESLRRDVPAPMALPRSEPSDADADSDSPEATEEQPASDQSPADLDSLSDDALYARADAGDAAAQHAAALRVISRQSRGGACSRAAAWLTAAAKAGHVESCYELGRMLRIGLCGLQADERQALQWLSKAAQRGHIGSMRVCVDLLLYGGADTRSPESAKRWLKKLVSRRDLEAHHQLFVLDRAAYRSVAVKGPSALNDSAVGSAIRAQGELLSDGPLQWTIQLGKRRIRVTPPVEVPAAAKAGRTVVVLGPVITADAVRALEVEVPEPAYKFTYALDTAGGVVGSTERTWVVNVSVQNSGAQPIRSIKLSVRCWQTHAPNDDREEITLYSISPGEQARGSATFNFYNYQYIGAASVPQVDVQVKSLEW